MAVVTLGVVSDTHGLLRPEVLTALAGTQHILHAGDVGDPAILARLSAVAPVTAIGGNIDRGGPCDTLPLTEAIELYGALFYLIHSVRDLDLDPVAAGIAAVVSGHTHRADVTVRNGVLFLNPGSIGPRRFQLPVTLALVEIDAGLLSARIVTL